MTLSVTICKIITFKLYDNNVLDSNLCDLHNEGQGHEVQRRRLHHWMAVCMTYDLVKKVHLAQTIVMLSTNKANTQMHIHTHKHTHTHTQTYTHTHTTHTNTTHTIVISDNATCCIHLNITSLVCPGHNVTVVKAPSKPMVLARTLSRDYQAGDD